MSAAARPTPGCRRRLLPRALAAWLGIVALCLNAVVPIHFAIGLAADFAATRECGNAPIAGPAQGPVWRVLAVLAGHDKDAGPARSHKGFHPQGGLCGFVANPAGFTLAAGAALLLPLQLTAIGPRFVDAGSTVRPRPAAYFSRAPPIRMAPVLF